MSGVTAILDGDLNSANNPTNCDGCNKDETPVRASSKVNPILMWLFRSSLPSKFVSIFERKVDQSMNQPRAVNPTQLLLQLVRTSI
jgi:hypothetical protein